MAPATKGHRAMPDSTQNDEKSAKIANAARESRAGGSGSSAEPADLEARRKEKRDREAAQAAREGRTGGSRESRKENMAPQTAEELARARAKARAARAAMGAQKDELPAAANDTGENTPTPPLRGPEGSASLGEDDTTSAQSSGESLNPEKEAERRARRARRKAREEKERKQRERDLAILQQAEEKKKEPSAVANGWTVIKMALGFGAAGWAVATMIFAILMGMEGGALLALRILCGLGGAAGGVYIYLYKRDLFNRVMNEE